MEYDVFISHASEDKDSFVRQLASILEAERVLVWYDEFSLVPGSSLRRSIDFGLSRCRIGIVVLSKNFFKKNWTNWELDGLVARQQSSGNEMIIPIWLDITKDELEAYSPPLADKVAIQAKEGIPTVVQKLLKVIKPSGATVNQNSIPTQTQIPSSTIMIDASSIFKGKELTFDIDLIVDGQRENIISSKSPKKVHRPITQGQHSIKLAFNIFIPGSPRGMGRYTVNLGDSEVHEKGETSEKKIQFELGLYIFKVRRYEYNRSLWEMLAMSSIRFEYLLDMEFQPAERSAGR